MRWTVWFDVESEVPKKLLVLVSQVLSRDERETYTAAVNTQSNDKSRGLDFPRTTILPYWGCFVVCPQLGFR